MSGNVAEARAPQSTRPAGSGPADQPSTPPAGHPPISRRLRKILASYWPSVILLLILAFLIILPVGILVYAAFLENPPRPGSISGGLTLANFADVLTPDRLPALFNSVIISVGGTALALVIGALLAWLAARTDVPGKWLIRLAGITPLFVSTLVGAQAWSYLGSPNQGYINIILKSIGIPFTVDINSLGGIIFVFGLYYAPYAYLFLYGALSLSNPDFEDAAQIHGAGLGRIMRYVTFPLALPALLGSSILIFVLIFENFPVPSVLASGSGTNTLPGLIYSLMVSSPSKSNEAAAITVLLTVVMILFIWIQQRILTKRQFTTVTGKGVRPRRIRLRAWRWPSAAFAWLYLLLAIVLPFFALGEMTFRASAYVPDVGSLFDPSTFTPRGLLSVLGDDTFWSSLTNSLLTGLGAAIVGVVIAIVASYIIYRTRLRGRKTLEFVAMIPATVPALALSMGMLWTWTVFPLPFPLYGTLAILILACVSRLMPQGFRGIAAGILQVGGELTESARVSGANRVTSITRILLPLIRNGIIGTLLLLFITTVRELSVLIFLFTSNTQTLAITIWSLINEGKPRDAAAMSLLYCALLLIITVISQRWEVDNSRSRA